MQISLLLANIYLHPLDELMLRHGYRMVRFADNFVVLCNSREEAEAALAEIRRWVDSKYLLNASSAGENTKLLTAAPTDRPPICDSSRPCRG